MPNVAVEGTITAGITGWSRVALAAGANPIVKINGKRVLVVGSGGEIHHKDDRDRPCFVLTGSAIVKINGIPAARVGDSVSDGDILSQDGAATNVNWG